MVDFKEYKILRREEMVLGLVDSHLVLVDILVVVKDLREMVGMEVHSRVL